MSIQKDKLKKRPESPLKALASMDFSTFENNAITNNDVTPSYKVILVDPNVVRNWHFHDRPQNELGDIESLAHEFLDPSVGQKQPCIVRSIDDKEYDYEVIAGERRWRAAKLAKINLAVIVQELDDSQAAYCQIAENHNRKKLSDYSIGMSFATLIKHDFLKQKDLKDKFNLSPVQINRYLSFAQLPLKLIEAIGDMSKISARTAAEVRSLYKKGEDYQKAIFTLASRLSTGKLGEKLLKQEIKKLLNKTTHPKISARKFLDATNRLVFVVKEKNNLTTVEFSSASTNKANKEKLYQMIKELLCK